MKYLLFRYSDDDQGGELLKEIGINKDFQSEEEILEWLPTGTLNYVGMRFLIVRAESWTTAVIHEKPVTKYAHIDSRDDETVMRKQDKQDKNLAIQHGIPADAEDVKDSYI